MDIKDFNHINDCWNYLDQFNHSVDELAEHLEDLPYKFGSFDIVNKTTAEEEGMIEVCNSYWDENVGGYEYDYHTVLIEN